MSERFYIQLQPVTPVHIGSGEEKDWIYGLDFIVDGNKAYVIDLKKVAENGYDINRITACFLNKDVKGVKQLLGNNLKAVSKRIFLYPQVNTNSNIKAFIRNQLTDKPVIPGSSLKGAIRSILFTYLRDNETSNGDVFGKLKDGEDFMRFIQVSDIELSKTRLRNTKIFNLHTNNGEWEGGWKHGNKTSENFNPNGFNTIYECVCEDEDNIGVGTISMKAQLFSMLSQIATQMPHAAAKNSILKGGLTTLFGIINAHTRAYHIKEKKFFEKFEADNSTEIVDCIDYLLEQLDDMSDNQYCMLKMAAGSGFHSITGDWQHEDYTDTGEWARDMNRRDERKFKAKSRKIAIEGDMLSLMGFVVLSQASKQDYEQALLSR